MHELGRIRSGSVWRSDSSAQRSADNLRDERHRALCLRHLRNFHPDSRIAVLHPRVILGLFGFENGTVFLDVGEWAKGSVVGMVMSTRHT
jgi:hypothetical protein